MDTVVGRNCKVTQLYYENAENDIINRFYMETAGENDGKRLSERVREIFGKIIQKFKEFIETIKRKASDFALKTKYKAMLLKCKIQLRGVIKDKEIRKCVIDIRKILLDATMEAKKLHDKFLRHNITYDDFVRGMERIEVDFGRKMTIVEQRADKGMIFDPTSTKGLYTIEEIAKVTYRFDDEVVKLVDKMNSDVETELRKMEDEAAKAAAASAETSSKEVAAAQRTGNFFTRANRVAIAAIVAAASVATTVGFLHRRAQKQSSSGSVNESVEDDSFFSTLLYENSEDDYDGRVSDDFLSKILEESALDDESNDYDIFAGNADDIFDL